jgi:hypothetical protein
MLQKETLQTYSLFPSSALDVLDDLLQDALLSENLDRVVDKWCVILFTSRRLLILLPNKRSFFQKRSFESTLLLCQILVQSYECNSIFTRAVDGFQCRRQDGGLCKNALG